MTVFRNDIYSGTQAQYSSDGNSDSMRVEAMVVLDKAKSRDGSDDGPALLRWATNEYFTQNPQRYYSPGHTALPLSRINARQIARNLVQLTIDYGGRQQIGSPRTVADFEAITWPVTVFASPDDGTDEPKYPRGMPMGVLGIGDVRGAIYGIPSFLSGRVIEEGTEDPVEGAYVLVIGPSLPVLKKTSVGGWFNIVKNSQGEGIYRVILFKLGYSMAIQSVVYAGEPRQATIEMNKWW